MKAMGDAYTNLLTDRNALLFQMQSYAACADPEIQTFVRERFAYAGAPGPGGDRRHAGRAVVVLLPRHAAQRDRRGRISTCLPSGEEWAACWVDPQRDARGSRRGPVGRLMLDRLAAFIYRRRRRVLWGSLVVVLVGGRLRGPGVRAARLERRLRRPAVRGAAGGRRHRPGDRRERGSLPHRAGAARGAGRLRRGAAESSTASSARSTSPA